MYYAIHTTELFENNFSLRIYNIDYQYIVYNSKYKINIWEGYKKGMTRQNLTFQMQKKARNPSPGGKKRGKKEDTSMARELKFWKHLTNAH